MLFSKFSLAAVASAVTGATALALPVAPRDQNNKFFFTLQAPDGAPPKYALGPTYLESNGQFQMAFMELPDFPGTPAYLNGSYLYFVPGTAGPYYGMSFAAVGDNYGTAEPIMGLYYEPGNEGYGISSDNTLYAKMDSAEESFFACNTTINDTPGLGLYWGVFNENGSSPTDCAPATLIVNYMSDSDDDE